MTIEPPKERFEKRLTVLYETTAENLEDLREQVATDEAEPPTRAANRLAATRRREGLREMESRRNDYLVRLIALRKIRL